MRSRFLVSLVIALALLAAAVAPALAGPAQQDLPVTVTLAPAVISMTITDAGAPGLNFGTVVPPSPMGMDMGQTDTTPALIVKIEPETNVYNISVQVIRDLCTGPQGWTENTQFFGGDFHMTFAIGQHTSYGCSVHIDGYDNLPAPNGNYWSPGDSQNLWSHISVMNNPLPPAGTYTTVIHFRAVSPYVSQ